MMPVVAGAAETKRQIVIYSAILVPLAVTPVLTGLGGIAYAITAIALGAVFMGLALKLRRAPEGEVADKTARQLFAFSILYLFVLFAVILVEKLIARLL